MTKPFLHLGRGAAERTSSASARHYQSLLIRKGWKTKERLQNISGERRRDICTLATLRQSLPQVKKRLFILGKKGFYPVIPFLIRFLSLLSCCIGSLPAAEKRWGLPIACICTPHRCQSVINCFQDRFKVATCSRSFTAEHKIMRNRNFFFPLKSWQIILLPVEQKTNNAG